MALVYPIASAVSLLGGEVPGALWLAGVASPVLGLPVWCLATGGFLLTTAASHHPVPAPAAT